MKHVPHSTFATSIQKIHTMKADISITKSRKGTEIVVSGKRINKYGIIAAIVFAVPMLILFQSIHGETTSHLSLVRFFMCILAAVLWGIERSGFFNGREKWAKGFENQRV